MSSRLKPSRNGDLRPRKFGIPWPPYEAWACIRLAVERADKKVRAAAAWSVLFLMLFPAVCPAASVILDWDNSTDADLAGYKIYYSYDSWSPFGGTGATEGNSPVDVGMATPLVAGTSSTVTLNGLDGTRTIYFAATAYNSVGLESVYSNILLITPWDGLARKTITWSGGKAMLKTGGGRSIKVRFR